MIRKILIACLLIAAPLLAQNANDTFALTTAAGKKITLQGTDEGLKVPEYKGKIIFLEFWGQDCGPCLMSIPHHVNLQEKYKDQLQIIAVEVTNTTREKLVAYAANPGKHIDMKHIDYYLNNKAKTKEAKASLQPAIEELKVFMKSGKKINYDLITTEEGRKLIYYIMERAQWKGFIPFLLVLDQQGRAATIVPGMADEKKLEELVKDLIAGAKKTK